MDFENIDMSQTLYYNSPNQRGSIDLNTKSNEVHHAGIGDEETPVSKFISRSAGRKKEKYIRKKVNEKNYDIEVLIKANDKILEALKKGKEQRANDSFSMKELMMLKIENERRKLDLQSAKQDYDIMMIDLETIKETSTREFFRKQQNAILIKKN